MSYDFSRITDRIYCGAHIGTQADVAEIRSKGITHVIDCETDDESGLFGLVVGEGPILLSDPTPDDGQVKGSSWFSPGIGFAITALVHPRFKVLTHCAAGVNRGPSMAYAILRAVTGLDGAYALNLIRTARPQAQIRYWPDADNALVELGWL